MSWLTTTASPNLKQEEPRLSYQELDENFFITVGYREFFDLEFVPYFFQLLCRSEYYNSARETHRTHNGDPQESPESVGPLHRVMCPSGYFCCMLLGLPAQHRQQAWLVYTFQEMETRLGVDAFNCEEAEFRARQMYYPHSNIGTYGKPEA
jgi:hypothetical protein